MSGELSFTASQPVESHEMVGSRVADVGVGAGERQTNGNGTNRKDEQQDLRGNASNQGNHFDSTSERKGCLACCGIFRFATGLDLVLTVLGILLAICTGAGIPTLIYLIRDLINEGFSRGAAGIGSRQIREMAWNFLSIGCAMSGSAWVSNVCLQVAAARQGIRLRVEYLRGLLRQEMAWQDQQGMAARALNFENDCGDVQAGLGEKLYLVAHNLAVALGCVGMALSQGWQMTLVLLASLPFLALIAAAVARLAAPQQRGREVAWEDGSEALEEALSGVRTWVALGAEASVLRRFAAHMRAVRNATAAQARNGALGGAAAALVVFGGFALGLWLGGWLQVQEEWNELVGRFYNGADSALCFISVLVAAFFVTQLGPGWAAMQQGAETVARVAEVTGREPAIDVEGQGGLEPESVAGRVELEGVEFAYPGRPESVVVRGVSMVVEAGQRVAVVGASGSGKSSVLALLMRFYDPSKGRVLLDGEDIRGLRVGWLRQQMGFVSQEPVLFAASVRDNLLLAAPSASQAHLEQACRTAHAHDFVSALPNGYETVCGEGGAQLSGGQKQRIAIARAVVADAKVLLLDEATSALDSESERVVQAALDAVSAGRSTVVVAHRLSSVRGADRIVVLDKGRVVEEGTHLDLIRRPGPYAKLVPPPPSAGAAGPELTRGMQAQAQTALGPTEIVLDEEEEGEEEGRGRRNSLESVDGSVHSGELGAEQSLLDVAGVSPALRPRSGARGGGWAAMRRLVGAGGWGPVGAGMAGVVLSASLVPLLSYMIVEMMRIYFFCFQVDIPIFLTKQDGREQITVGYYDAVEGCAADCDFNIINGLGIQGSFYNETAGQEEGCTFSNWEELCLNVGRFSIKFYRDAHREGCYDDMTAEIAQYCVWVVLVGVAAGLAVLLQSWGMRVEGARGAEELRVGALGAVLRQNMGFFDAGERSTGALGAMLLQDAGAVEQGIGVTAGLLCINLLLAAGSMVLGLYRGWVLALICIAVFPAKFAFAALRAWFDARYSPVPHLQQAGALAVEAASAARTVAANCLHAPLVRMYRQALPQLSPRRLLAILASGLLFAISVFLQFAVYFMAFVVGANFMIWPPLDPEDPPYSFLDVLQVFFSIAFMGFAVQLLGPLLSDFARARSAAARIFACIDTEPEFTTESGGTLPQHAVGGKIDFVDVVFSYPQRPDAVVLNRMSFSVAPHATTALVGSSGSGKSTTIQLIERFYNPSQGQVLLDGVDLRQLDLRWLRRQMALVSQEPVLFNCSVADNIRHGKEGASMSEVEVAARKANAHPFIVQFDRGYETQCGRRGAKLSGGQKQRIAIARSIIANPKILLLDEATSALDTESERLVQAALDKIRRDRTCIVVAHRLSTIRSADSIVVLSKGKVVEQGSHSELIANQGAYAKLVGAQLEGNDAVGVATIPQSMPLANG